METVTEVTGIKAVVEKLTSDCGCEKRKAKLNDLVPFPKAEFVKMTAAQQLQWKNTILPEWERGYVSGSTKKLLADMYMAVYGKPAPTMGRCGGGCLARTLEEVEQVYLQSCDGQE